MKSSCLASTSVNVYLYAKHVRHGMFADTVASRKNSISFLNTIQKDSWLSFVNRRSWYKFSSLSLQWCVQYSALPINCGLFSPDNSQEALIACPLVWQNFYIRIKCKVCGIVLYGAAIYRVYSNMFYIESGYQATRMYIMLELFQPKHWCWSYHFTGNLAGTLLISNTVIFDKRYGV